LEYQLPDLIDLARAFPDTQIIVDHVGGLFGVGPYENRREQRFSAWRKNILALAALPNVAMKLGGLGMPHAGLHTSLSAAPLSSQELADAWRPYLETCIEAFGAARCMFESNFPVDAGAANYAVLWNVFKRIASSDSANEKAALFSGTAARIYKIEL
jgi:predicted TIM-barrel fold metal-dependent hydrolase